MKTSPYVIRLLLAAPLMFAACSDDDGPEPDPCDSKTISLTATVNDAHEGESDGNITAEGSGSSGFTYSIDGSNFQSSGVFEDLAAGDYTITAKDQDDCTGSQQFTVEELSGAEVSFSGQIKPIIESKCWSCHQAAGQGGFPNADLSTDAKIKENATRINTEVQAGRMPKNGTITDQQKADIASWVAAGAPINN